MQVDNVCIYGLNESIVASGYPMRTDLPKKMELPDQHRRDVAHKLGSVPVGTAHDNYLNGIVIQFDLTCSVKMWQQLQRYHFIDFVSSSSTVHRLAKMDLSKGAYNEYVDMNVIHHMETLQSIYQTNPTEENFMRLLYNNPVGMNLTARMTTNSRQLKTIYNQRKNHRLKEWRDFCDWIKSLPEEVVPWLERKE